MSPDEFDALGLPAAFDLDRETIRQAYLRLAAALHPDLATGSDEAARRMAEINRAKAIIENPELRADALLRRLGGPPADREKTLPKGFLGQMLNVREEMESALGDTDSIRRQAHSAVWEQWSRGQRAAAVNETSMLFASLPSDPADRADALRSIRIRLNAWRYIERLIEQLDPAQGAGRGQR